MQPFSYSSDEESDLEMAKALQHFGALPAATSITTVRTLPQVTSLASPAPTTHRPTEEMPFGRSQQVEMATDWDPNFSLASRLVLPAKQQTPELQRWCQRITDLYHRLRTHKDAAKFHFRSPYQPPDDRPCLTLEIDQREVTLLHVFAACPFAQRTCQALQADIRFVVNNQLFHMIERKSEKDLSQSIKKNKKSAGHHVEQVYRLHRLGIPSHQCTYLIEQQPASQSYYTTKGLLPWEALRGARANLQIAHGFRVTVVQHPLETGYTLLRWLLSYLEKGAWELSHDHQLRLIDKGQEQTPASLQTPKTWVAMALARVPRVSLAMGQAIANEFPTFARFSQMLKRSRKQRADPSRLLANILYDAHGHENQLSSEPRRKRRRIGPSCARRIIAFWEGNVASET